jgi:MHS family shikimate/dehydroshikimate transporter-like MFS transporter
MLLSTGAFALVSQLPEDQFMSWGWRLPFLFSFVLVIIGLAIRLKIAESPIFVEVAKRGKLEKLPLLQVLRFYPKEIILGVGARFAADIIFITANIFALSYATTSLGLPRTVILAGIMLAAALQIVTIPFYGWLSDRVGRHKLYMIGCAYMAVCAFVFFPLIDTKQTWIIMVAYVLALPIGFACTYGLLSSLYAEMFPTQVRFTGISLVYQIAGIVTAGPAPIIAALLYSQSKSTFPIALYISLTAILSLICVAILSRMAAKRSRQTLELVPQKAFVG